MKKIGLALCFSILVSLSSHVLVSEGQAALRPCTGKEVSVEISYRARIAILEFYTPGSSTISGLREQLQNLYNKCESEGFKAGKPKAKAPVCSTSDISKLIDIKNAYSQQVDLEASNSNEIAAQEREYNRAISTGQSARAQQISIKISALTREIQYHYRMQMLYLAAFNAYATDCKNSSVTLPRRTLGEQATQTTNPTLNDLPQRFIGYRTGDVRPVSILSDDCGPKASRDVFVLKLDSSGEWVRTKVAWPGINDVATKYALQFVKFPVDQISISLSSGTWQGVNWPYTIQHAFAVARCDLPANGSENAEKKYDINSLKNKLGAWARQDISNLKEAEYQGEEANYRVDQLVPQDLTDPSWKCSIKKPKTSTVKKNGKMVKVTKPAVSDFRVNLSSDGSTISIWECDDIEAGEFIEVQKVLISESWDVSDKDSSNNALWEVAMNDPRHVNWTWACPAGTGNRTCYRVGGLK
jgi:hypothetical protein